MLGSKLLSIVFQPPSSLCQDIPRLQWQQAEQPQQGNVSSDATAAASATTESSSNGGGIAFGAPAFSIAALAKYATKLLTFLQVPSFLLCTSCGLVWTHAQLPTHTLPQRCLSVASFFVASERSYLISVDGNAPIHDHICMHSHTNPSTC